MFTYVQAAAEAMRWARQQPAQFVMKPQREGGGNNIYGDDIVEVAIALSHLPLLQRHGAQFSLRVPFLSGHTHAARPAC
jgi:hypothetical protein